MPAVDRRTFLASLSAAGLVAVLPSGCAHRAPVGGVDDPLDLPLVPPDAWDPIGFNRDRGNAGAIPETYRAAINGEDGAAKHLGKHLPWVPALSVPAGLLALMWGDPSKGYTAHPNAAPSDTLPGGHFYDWIRVRKATRTEAEEVESRFSSWPAVLDGDTGAYAAWQGEDPAADDGRNTVQLVHLPPDVRPGDVVRVHAHCRTHGEYVDFVTVPG